MLNTQRSAIGQQMANYKLAFAAIIALAAGWPQELFAAPVDGENGSPETVPAPSSATPPDAPIAPAPERPGIYVELPIVDAPFVAANGGSFPSMQQSLWITAGLSTPHRKLVTTWDADPYRLASLLLGHVPSGTLPRRASPAGCLGAPRWPPTYGEVYLARGFTSASAHW